MLERGSRDSFCRYKELYGKGGELTLQELSRRNCSLIENRADSVIEAAVARYSIGISTTTHCAW
jgi:hypothetical protein